MLAEQLITPTLHLGEGNIYALEGLDGVGKTSIGMLLAQETDSVYLYCTDGSRLKRFRKFRN